MEQTVGIADFGLSEEFMLPITSDSNFSLDPLTPIISLCDSLGEHEIILFQMIFKGITTPWSRDILYSVSDGVGGSFFADSPEMLNQAQEKISSPLFSVVVRMAVQGATDDRTQYLGAECARNIISVSTSEYNKLIPLSNEQYEYQEHLKNVYHRTSNRIGMILNTDELVKFAHYPNKSIVSKKLHEDSGKTKALSRVCINQKYDIGINVHNGLEQIVTITDEQRLRHTHLIGATGVGKSTLIANMMLEDMKLGNGCVLFDPHGDIVEDVLLLIPKNRVDDVIVIDPSDTNYPIGFNLLHAHSEAEKIVLSSDLVSAFKRHATAWGDNMTAVLSNAINTFLESNTGGTLIELKRFLIEESFRNEFLETVDDNSLHYYWEHEYNMVKKGIAPLLTRIDTFLRPKIVRFMLAQKQGVDFKACIEEKKIVLIKLSQGLIGGDNSFLLASLFVSKFNQVAQSRQNIPKEQRHPFYMYLDEFHNFMTPSITSILSGARKYGLGLILAHQDLAQIENPKILSSVLSNPFTRICFRLGDADASKLESGFEFFERNDLQSLGIGEAIMRVGSSNNDFNINTYPLDNPSNEAEIIRQNIIQNTRIQYAQPKEQVQELLDSLLPRFSKKKIDTKKAEEKAKIETIPQEPIKEVEEIQQLKKEFQTKKEIPSETDFEEQKEKYLKQAEEQIEIRKHLATQNLVRSLALQRGFKVTFEAPVTNGRVDVELLKNDLRIAVEISVTNTAEYEVKNIEKCLAEDYSLVFMISEDNNHLQKIQELALKSIDSNEHNKIHFFVPNELSLYLDATKPKVISKEKRVSGYRVKVNYKTDTDSTGKQKSITDIIMKALRKK